MIRFDQPISDGMKRTELMLFPFDFRKWLPLALCAWLASFYSSGFQYRNSSSQGATPAHQTFTVPGSTPVSHSTAAALPDLSVAWVAGIVPFVFVLVMALMLLFTWLGARGRFMLLDNVLHNRALVADPWNRFKKPANSLFLLAVIIFLVCLGLCGVLWLYGWLIGFGPILKAREIVFIPVLCVLIPVFLLLMMFVVWYGDFVVPVMYKTGYTPVAAVVRLWELICSRPLDAILYLLMRLVLEIVIVVITLILGLVTCCVGCLPFISSFITLPLAVFRQSFILDCLRQFDPGLDLWPEAAPPVPAIS